MTTNWRPSGSRRAIGHRRAGGPLRQRNRRSVSPVIASTALSASSPPPTNTSPPAVTIAPGAPRGAELRRQRHVLQRRMRAQRRRVAERHPPGNLAAIEIDGRQVAVRRLEQRQAVHERRVGGARLMSRRPLRRRAGWTATDRARRAAGSPACSTSLHVQQPGRGSNAPPPQLAPPMTPGRITVPCSDGGV